MREKLIFKIMIIRGEKEFIDPFMYVRTYTHSLESKFTFERVGRSNFSGIYTPYNFTV